MSITLKIVSYQRLTPGQQESFQSDIDKFSIGRNPDNHWPLPDPQRFMSGTHCWVENRNGTWVLTDTSTNGVFINGSDQRVTRGDSVELKNGDNIRLGDYELQVNLEADSRASAPVAAGFSPSIDMDPFQDDLDEFDGLDDVDDSLAKPPQQPPAGQFGQKDPNTPISQMDSNLLGPSVSIDSLYQFDDEEEVPEVPKKLSDRGNQGSPLEQHFSAPRVAQPPPGPAQSTYDSPENKYAADFDDLPDDWDEETGLIKTPSIPQQAPPPAPSQPAPPFSAQEPVAAQAPPPAPVRVDPPSAPAAGYAARQTAVSSGTGAELAAFAEGAGLDLSKLSVDDQEEFFRDLGALLKTMTQGLMQALTSRNQVRSEFRLEQTMIGPRENNPLKFSISAEEAIMRLVSRSDKAYQSGVEAAAEAVDDINAHQLAVMAGTEAALKSILRRFSPKKLEVKFGNDSSLRKAVPMLKKARYWDFYKVLFDEISEAVDDDFQQLFGTEFSTAYEEQLDRLKSSRKEPSR